MKKVLFTTTRNTPRILEVLLEKFQAFKLNSNSTYDQYREKAEEFVGQTPEAPELLKLRLDIVVEDLEFDPWLPREACCDFIVGLENFFIVVKQVLKNETEIVYDGFSRQPSPSINAYDYIGHNKLDIIYNKTKYSSLYK